MFCKQKKESLGHNKMIASKRRTIAVPIFLVCLNTFVSIALRPLAFRGEEPELPRCAAGSTFSISFS
ncbi:hypothetical protein, partial [Priestia flexa]|uniref:hypothetical protein n=1 Tax=Priestia flexa TaxID=86664 RepID=UPI0019532327